jgi:hypothetical protein
VSRAPLLALALVAGCVVSRPRDLETRLWTCESSADCAEGLACADRSVLGDDFCRPTCDPAEPASCDGVCTRTGECLDACVIWGDIASPCPAGHACVRTDLLGDEGVCFPTPICSRDDECPDGTGCLNSVLDLPASIPGTEYAADHLYCVAVPDADQRCPSGYLVVGDAEGGALCLPRCESEGARCPPGLACLRQLGFLFGQPGSSPCYPGLFGTPCQDDAQCLLGRCVDVGEGRRACTLGCFEADQLFGQVGAGCEAIERSAGGLRLDALSVACEDVSGDRVCVPRGASGAPCNAETLCAAGLECRSFPAGGGEVVRFCSRDCALDRDCETPGAPGTAYCQRTPLGGSCLPRSLEGGSCARPEHCRPGLLCEDARCIIAP